MQVCSDCHGKGTRECPTCYGTGVCRCFDCDNEHDCGHCDGEGSVDCETCKGTGEARGFEEGQDPGPCDFCGREAVAFVDDAAVCVLCEAIFLSGHVPLSTRQAAML